MLETSDTRNMDTHEFDKKNEIFRVNFGDMKIQGLLQIDQMVLTLDYTQVYNDFG